MSSLMMTILSLKHNRKTKGPTATSVQKDSDVLCRWCYLLFCTLRAIATGKSLVQCSLMLRTMLCSVKIVESCFRETCPVTVRLLCLSASRMHIIDVHLSVKVMQSGKAPV